MKPLDRICDVITAFFVFNSRFITAITFWNKMEHNTWFFGIVDSVYSVKMKTFQQNVTSENLNSIKIFL